VIICHPIPKSILAASFCRTKEIKKDPVKGLRIAVKKVFIAVCSASTLAQRLGCYFHLHLVYAIKLLTVLLAY
jgi:hypothetical protein